MTRKFIYILCFSIFLLFTQGESAHSFSHALNEVETTYDAMTLEKTLSERSEKAEILQKEVAQQRYEQRQALVESHIKVMSNQSAERKLLIRLQQDSLKEQKSEIKLPKLTYEQVVAALFILLLFIAIASAVRHHGGLPEWKIFILMKLVPAPAGSILREDHSTKGDPYRVLPKFLTLRRKKKQEERKGTQLTIEKIETEGIDTMTQVYERRAHVRYDIYTDVTVQFIIPDQTFTPLKFHATAEDISLLGMRVKSSEINKEQFTNLLRTMPYARVYLKLPFIEETIRLHGQIVWAKFEKADDPEQESCVVGLRFSQFTDEALSDFRKTLQMVVQNCQKPTSQEQQIEHSEP